jgi:hypothetical protein
MIGFNISLTSSEAAVAHNLVRSSDRRCGFVMPWACLVLLLLATGPAVAQSHYYNGRGNLNRTPAIAADLAVAPCINPTQTPYNADPSGVVDSTRALQAAITAAQSQNTLATPGYVCIPGGNYKVSSTITINSGRVTVCGVGTNVTVIRPTQQGDVFYVGKSPAASYISGVSFCNFRIYRVDNPTAGAGLHYEGAQLFTVENVQIDGMFYGYWCESCFTAKFNFTNSMGNNTTPGARIYKFSKGTYPDATNNAAIYLTDLQARAGTAPQIETAMEISSADGITCFACHLGFSSGPALLLEPGSTTDKLVGVDFPGGTFDTAQYGVYIAQPANYIGTFGIFTFSGSTFFISTLDGLFVDSSATALKNVVAVGTRFFLNGRNGMNLNAGKGYNFNGAYFSANNNGNTGGVHALIGGTTTAVNLDSSYFGTDTGKHAVAYNIVTSGSADHLYGSHLNFQDATIRNMSLRASGTHVDLVAAP